MLIDMQVQQQQTNQTLSQTSQTLTSFVSHLISLNTTGNTPAVSTAHTAPPIRYLGCKRSSAMPQQRCQRKVVACTTFFCHQQARHINGKLLNKLCVRSFQLCQIAQSAMSLDLLLACTLANTTCAIINIMTTLILSFLIVSWSYGFFLVVVVHHSFLHVRNILFPTERTQLGQPKHSSLMNSSKLVDRNRK